MEVREQCRHGIRLPPAPDRLRQRLDHVILEDHLGVSRLELFSDYASTGYVGVLIGSTGIARGIGLQAVTDYLMDEVCSKRRIDTPREQGTYRNVADTLCSSGIL